MEKPPDNTHTRDLWIRQQLESLTAGWRLLDAGAGEQQYKKYCAHLKYVSQDFAKYVPEQSHSGLQMQTWDYQELDIVSDITSIPEKDASFDAVLCTEVLEHVPDAVSALREMSRLIKSGGALIITAPIASLTHFAPYHFSTGFNRHFYEHHLPKLGFSITELTFNGNYFSWLEQELRRMPSMAKRYAGQEPSVFNYRRITGLRKMLTEYAKIGGESSELLAFGCHIRAKKL